MQEFLMSTWSIVLTAAVGYLVTNSRDSKKSRKKLEEKREQEKLDQTKRQIVMEEALCAMLHERIVRFCERLLIIGYVTADDLKELDYLYNPYRALGGNGTAERLYKQNLVNSGKYSIKGPYERTPQFYVVHNTYNDAPAKNEVSYMIGNNNKVSFHYAVDDVEVVQGLLENRSAFASGDGAKGQGNLYGIHVETCYST